MQKFFILLILLFIHTGCGKRIPNWYTTANSDNKCYYGVGAASNEDAAIKNALSDAVGKISAVVSSKSDYTATLINGKAGKAMEKNILLKSKAIKINNYDVLNRDISKDVFYIKLCVSKAKLQENYLKDLYNTFDEILSFKIGYQNMNIVSQISTLEKMLDGLNDMSEDIDMYRTIGGTDSIIYKHKEEFYKTQAELSSLKTKVRFKISGNNVNMKKVITTFIANNGLVIVENSENYELLADADIKTENAFGEYKCSINAALKLIDSQKKFTIAQKQISLQGFSVNSENDSCSNAIKELNKQISSKKINELLE